MAFNAPVGCVAGRSVTQRRREARRGPELSRCQTCVFPSDLGWMAAVWREDRLYRLAFGYDSRAAALAAVNQAKASRPSSLENWASFVERMQAVAEGGDDDLRDVPVDLDDRTDFQRAVLKQCRLIPRGQVRTYAELASRAGHPGSARAVGNVMATNRLPLVIPCHRVVGTGGKLGGFSAPQGLAMKIRLLEMEGAETLRGGKRIGG